jgi:hypothetical protein
MKLHILYNVGTPIDRDVEYLQRRLAERQITPQLLDADSREAIALAGLYDLTGRPAAVITDDAGQLVQRWQGNLPSAEEIANYYVAT